MSGFALQQAVYAALGNIGVPVYDHVPRNVAPPYVVIGESTVNDWSTKTEQGSEHLLTVHIWSRGAGMQEARVLADAARSALDGAALSVTGVVLVGIAFQSVQFARQKDGVTLRAALKFRAVTEP